MRKKVFSLILVLAMLCAALPAAVVYAEAGTKPSVGDGSEESPYEIGTADELLWFADRVSDGGRASICAVLTADITVNPGTFDVNGTYTAYDGETATTWTPIGISSDYPYSGIFDGQNHTISGIYYDSATVDNIGLFGYTNGATIKNVALTNSYIRGYDCVGGIIGIMTGSGTVTNCYNAATVRGEYRYVGGIAGYFSGTIEKCGNNGVISANTYYGGGIAGLFVSGTINNCYNTASVTAGTYAGGIVGEGDYGAAIKNCYNTGNVYYAILARQGSSNSVYYCTISNCYALNSSSTNNTYGGTYKNSTAFSSGEVAYLLQGSQSEDVWGEYIGYEDYPSLFGKKVYYNSTEDEYYNINSISLDTSAVTLAVGDGAELNAALTPSTAQASDISWSSSNVYVATVSSSGKVLAIGEGTAVITASAGEQKAYCVVTVANSSVDVIAVTLDKSTLTLTAGDTAALTATVYPDDATDKTVTWTSSDTSVATVSGGTVTAVAEGSAAITASAGAYSASCTVTVTATEPDDGEYAYVINGLSLVSETGEALDSAPVGSSFIVNAAFTEVQSRAAADYVFIAVYDENDVLMSLDYISADFTPNTEYNVGFHIAAQSAAVGRIKAFIWNAFDSITPLAEDASL